MSRISAIIAMAQNRVIGNNNQLPWHLPADLQHFKQLTTGHPIIMGRKTYESIGRPLPNRTNIIITRNKEFTAANCLVVSTVEDAIRVAQEIDPQEIFIIGGADIFKISLAQLDRLYLTIIHENIAGDVYLPQFAATDWKEIQSQHYQADEKNSYDYSFITMDRIASRDIK